MRSAPFCSVPLRPMLDSNVTGPGSWRLEGNSRVQISGDLSSSFSGRFDVDENVTRAPEAISSRQ